MADTEAPDFESGSGFNPRNRKQYGTGKGKAKEGSIEHAKKRTRNIQRLMQRNADLPANVRNEMERELASHKQTINDKTFQRKRSAMISKYHMVRFFERKKASRLVKQLGRKVEQAEDEEERTNLQRQLHIAQVDEAYTLFHPHAEAYISLYGGPKEKEDNDETEKTPIAKAALEAERPPMWSIIEQKMKEGEGSLRRLRERRSPDDDGSASNKPHPARAALMAKPRPIPANAKPTHNGVQTGLNRRDRRKMMRESMAAESVKEGDDAGDGAGFFEM